MRPTNDSGAMSMNVPFDAAQLPEPPWFTPRLLLRPFVESDLEDAHRVLDGDAEVWRHDPGYAPSRTDRLGNVRRYGALRDQFGFGPAAACLRDDSSTLVGQGGLNPYVYDHRDGTRTVEFEVTYKLGRAYWGQGYATEIARFWLDFAFREVRLPRVLVCPERANGASVRVLGRLGATFEDDWLDEATVIARFTRERWLGGEDA